ncbi:MAG: TetR/AcrR family transcriptional regulator [Chloroflexi bacterium]|nr:MAG: TetR/AcrR family transcriptional regulator [Chloroflexota bacterium]
MTRTGRRPGEAGTRDKILAAARSHFTDVGFDGATIRGIAAAAKVDPKLILHYFESKEGIFVAAVDFPFDPAVAIPPLLAPGLDGLGSRLVRFFLETWESPAGSPMLALIRSVVSSERAATLLRGFVTREVLARLARILELDQPHLRATLVGSQLVGLAMLRYVVKVEPLASAPVARVAAWIGPTLQRYLTDPAATRSEGRPRKRTVKT